MRVIGTCPAASAAVHPPSAVILEGVRQGLQSEEIALRTMLRLGEAQRRLLLEALCRTAAATPEAAVGDVALVFEHLVSSPLLVVHWLCVFPSYIYALRLLLAKAGVLAADVMRTRLGLAPNGVPRLSEEASTTEEEAAGVGEQAGSLEHAATAHFARAPRTEPVFRNRTSSPPATFRGGRRDGCDASRAGSHTRPAVLLAGRN